MIRGKWRSDSWRDFPVEQQPAYADPEAQEEILNRVQGYPPLVAVSEVENLKRQIAQAASGGAFMLQGGNCAERFIDCNETNISNKLKILLQMSVILTYGVRKPVIRIGRLAGQYAKPRSKDFETVEGVRMPSYRGDAINSVEPNIESREPAPNRLESCYFHAAATLNYIRALIDGGFADLHNPYKWNLHSVEKSKNWPEYQVVVERILDAINFMDTFGGTKDEALGWVDFFTSHEGLLLNYEQAMTRRDPVSGKDYNLGAHKLWIGARTRDIEGAHIEYFRGIANPIGVKVEGTMAPKDLVELIKVLNADNEPGRLTLITRFGADKVREYLPGLIDAVAESGQTVAWSCDPMHGNTVATKGGRKTRAFSRIVDELQTTFAVHTERKSHLAGVHFELTAENVTECIGGPASLTSEDLERRYETYCDPRLNGSQSLEMAFLIARWLKETR